MARSLGDQPGLGRQRPGNNRASGSPVSSWLRCCSRPTQSQGPRPRVQGPLSPPDPRPRTALTGLQPHPPSCGWAQAWPACGLALAVPCAQKALPAEVPGAPSPVPASSTAHLTPAESELPGGPILALACSAPALVVFLEHLTPSNTPDSPRRTEPPQLGLAHAVGAQ